MAYLQKINSDIELVTTFKFIAQAFEEISVMRMRKVRQSVLNAREFIENLSDVFYDVKASYEDKIQHMLKEKKLSADPLKQNKKLSVLVSANAKLYGEVVFSVFSKFYENVQNNDEDIIIIGRLGKELYDKQPNPKPYLYFEISDAEIFLQDIQNIMYHLVKYDDIDVYYAHFENILSQRPNISNISGSKPFEIKNTPKSESNSEPQQAAGEVKEEQFGRNLKFVFEPQIEDVLAFFKAQVFIALFKQTIHESHLAHYASRVTAMEEALTHIDQQAQLLYADRRKFKKLAADKKTLERIAGRTLLYK
jgi:ATP synthase F1 gamma subunit